MVVLNVLPYNHCQGGGTILDFLALAYLRTAHTDPTQDVFQNTSLSPSFAGFTALELGIAQIWCLGYESYVLTTVVNTLIV